MVFGKLAIPRAVSTTASLVAPAANTFPQQPRLLFPTQTTSADVKPIQKRIVATSSPQNIILATSQSPKLSMQQNVVLSTAQIGNKSKALSDQAAISQGVLPTGQSLPKVITLVKTPSQNIIPVCRVAVSPYLNCLESFRLCICTLEKKNCIHV